MKKVSVLVTVIMILVCCISNGYTAQDNTTGDIEDVSIYFFSPYINEHDLIKNNYKTTDKNEIRMISHQLKSLMTKSGGVPSDTRFIRITFNYTDGREIRYVIYPGDLNVFDGKNPGLKGKAYGHSIDKYYRLCDFINSLILNKFDKSATVSTEPSSWAKGYIDKAIIEGLIPQWNQIGYTNDIPRVEVCQLVYELLSAKNIDKDVPTDYKYLKDYPFDDTKDLAVKELYVKNIIRGKSETEFCPYDYITREEFARVLSETCRIVCKDGVTTSEELPYNDKNQISDWAVDSVQDMTTLGLMVGDENGNFNPQSKITKEQVITTLLRLYELEQTKN